MAFCFKRKEPVRKGIRRLATERIESALDCLKDVRRAEAVHEVRKDIKKVRAILKLARPDMPKKDYRHQTEILRKAASELAATRDAYVKGSAFEHLSDHFDGQLRPRRVRQLRKAFAGDLAKAQKQFTKKKLTVKVKQALQRIHKQLDDVEFTAKGWKAIRPGLTTAYTCGRRDYDNASATPSPEHLHEWRKRVKELWYQLRILQPICPEDLDPLAEEFKDLGECLGHDHDLFLLQQALEEDHGLGLPAADRLMVTSLIEKRQRELRLTAMEKGARLYAEKPADFCARLARQWHLWRSGKSRHGSHRDGRGQGNSSPSARGTRLTQA
jgi:CHAD domain-containing protein